MLFLKQLLTQFKEHLNVIWDGAKIHCGEAVKNFLATDPQAHRLQLYRIPAYSPELNASEQIWNYAKNVSLKNVFSKNISVLKTNVTDALEELKYNESILKAFFKHPKVKW